MVTPTWDVKKKNRQAADTWRGNQEPDTITEAVRIGEQIIDLLNQATALVEHACLDAETIIDNAHLRCQPILERLASVSRLNILGDHTQTQAINRIIYDIDTQRQRWLRAVDSPLP